MHYCKNTSLLTISAKFRAWKTLPQPTSREFLPILSSREYTQPPHYRALSPTHTRAHTGVHKAAQTPCISKPSENPAAFSPGPPHTPPDRGLEKEIGTLWEAGENLAPPKTHLKRGAEGRQAGRPGRQRGKPAHSPTHPPTRPPAGRRVSRAGGYLRRLVRAAAPGEGWEEPQNAPSPS